MHVDWPGRSDFPEEHENNHDDEDCSETSAWTVAPFAAVRPCRKRADEEKDENDEQYGVHAARSDWLWWLDASVNRFRERPFGPARREGTSRRIFRVQTRPAPVLASM